MDFINFVKGKKCIFIGGCPNIIGLGKGAEIDGYDIVARSNGGFPVQEHLQKDYGKRCDILYINNQYQRHLRKKETELRWFFQNGVKYLCFKSIKKIELKIRSLTPLISKIQSVHNVSGLLMGPVIITDILNCLPKELFLTGIDFMASKSKKYKPFDYPEYYDGYLPKEIQIEGNAVKERICNGHNIYENAKYIYDKWQTGLLKTDDFIYKILEKIVKNGE